MKSLSKLTRVEYGQLYRFILNRYITPAFMPGDRVEFKCGDIVMPLEEYFRQSDHKLMIKLLVGETVVGHEADNAIAAVEAVRGRMFPCRRPLYMGE